MSRKKGLKIGKGLTRRKFLGAVGGSLLAMKAAGCAGPKGAGKAAKKRVLVIGGGMAGLAAGIAVLEEGGADRFDVTLATMGHKLGGKISYWKDPDGYSIGHGLHGIYGFYTEMPRLLKNAGIEKYRDLISNNGVLFWYEDSNKKINRMQIYDNAADNYAERLIRLPPVTATCSIPSCSTVNIPGPWPNSIAGSRPKTYAVNICCGSVGLLASNVRAATPVTLGSQSVG